MNKSYIIPIASVMIITIQSFKIERLKTGLYSFK